LNALLVGGLQGADAVAHDVPAEDFFIDVGELDAAGELGEVGVLLDEGLRVEDDGGVEVLLEDLVVGGAAEFLLDFLVGEAEVEADAGELDAFSEVGAVPEDVFAVGFFDDDHGFLRGRGGGAAAEGSSVWPARRAAERSAAGRGCRPRRP